MHLVGIAQSLGLFVVVCLATAAVLSLAMAALARMERATVAAPRAAHGHRRRDPESASAGRPDRARADRVSSPGSCSYRPRTR